MDDTTRVQCPFCGEYGVWAWPGGADVPDNLFTPPAGHTVELVDEVRYSTCPAIETTT